jgi:hypothetical protein
MTTKQITTGISIIFALAVCLFFVAVIINALFVVPEFRVEIVRTIVVCGATYLLFKGIFALLSMYIDYDLRSK